MTISRRRFVGGIITGAGAGAGALTTREANAKHVEHSYFAGHAGRYGLLHDTTLCVGCRTCETACQTVNDLQCGTTDDCEKGDTCEESLCRPGDPDGPHRRPNHRAYTIVNRYDVDGETIYRKQQCMHCNEPSCVSVCLVSAFTKTPEGPVLYDPDACMGCRYCMSVCPYYALAYEYDSNNPRVMRCTMCYDRIKDGLLPGCAEACPTGAVAFGKRSDLLAIARDRIHKHPDRYVRHIFGEHEFGGTSWLLLAGTSFGNLGLGAFEHASHTPLPELTKSFLSLVPLVLVMWPGLLLGFYAFTKRREEMSEAEARARVVEALMKADEETKATLAAAAKRAGKDKEKAIAAAVKKALAEQASKEGGK